MRAISSVILSLALTAGVLSCASTPAQKASSPPPPAPSATMQTQEPAAKAQQAAPAEDSLPNQGSAAAGSNTAAGSALSLPDAPKTRAAPEVDTAQASAAPEGQKFPLSIPQSPSTTAGKKEPAAAASTAAPRAQKPAAAAAGPQASGARQQAASAASAPAGSAPAGSSQQAGQTAAGSLPAAGGSAAQSPGSTYGKLREIYARVGDDLQIGLDGSGFLFLGFPDRSPEGDGMSFKGKETRDAKTWFSFKAVKLGTYDLDFLKQDNATGSSSKETVRVHVVSDSDFQAAVAQSQGPAQVSTEPGDPAFAAKLSSLGQYDAAIAELLKGYREGNPELNDQIARLYYRTGSYDAAAKYFTKNLAEQGRLGESAVLGLARVAIAQNDQPELLSLLKRLLSVKDQGLEETLVAAVRFEREKQEVGLGIDLATEYLSRYPDGKWRDEADYLLARLLEADSQFRDIARARGTYKEILDRFPESAFAADAKRRIEYIDRHFFQVR
ncbi:MAG: outer membrane protein assembly factor BamD [Spirochaetia bacterium]